MLFEKVKLFPLSIYMAKSQYGATYKQRRKGGAGTTAEARHGVADAGQAPRKGGRAALC
jgi:hypothetical protein